MKTAFVTGGNRGIGLSCCDILSKKGYKVYMGCRDIEKGKKAIQSLGNPDNIIPIEIDVSDENSIKKAYKTYLSSIEDGEKLDIFINNAAVNLDWIPNVEYKGVFDVDYKTTEQIFRTNTLGQVFTIKYFQENMRDGGSVVCTGSGAAEFWQHTADTNEYPFYAASKVAAIMLTKKMAAALKNRNISVNIACPGWCKTDMGGDYASDGPEVGADSFIKAAFIGETEKPTGKYFRYGNLIPIDVYPISAPLPVLKRNNPYHLGNFLHYQRIRRLSHITFGKMKQNYIRKKKRLAELFFKMD